MDLNKRQMNLLQRFCDMKPKYQYGIKYTGSSMASFSQLVGLMLIEKTPTPEGGNRYGDYYRITDAGLAALGLPPFPPPTPTLDKIAKVRQESQAIGEFLEWLNEQGIVLCHWQEWCEGEHDEFPMKGYVTIPKSRDALLHEFFEIDADAEERERRALLDYAREHQTP